MVLSLIGIRGQSSLLHAIISQYGLSGREVQVQVAIQF